MEPPQVDVNNFTKAAKVQRDKSLVSSWQGEIDTHFTSFFFNVKMTRDCKPNSIKRLQEHQIQLQYKIYQASAYKALIGGD